MSSRFFSLGFALLIILAFTNAATIVLYNQGIALIEEDMQVKLTQGINEVKLTVPEEIMVDSLLFTPEEGITISSYSYEYDTANISELLRKELGKIITVYTENGAFTGTLIAYYSDALVLDTNSKILYINEFQRVEMEKPEKLAIKPELKVKLYTQKDEIKKLKFSYLSNGFRWDASYALVLDENMHKGTLSCWASLENSTSKSFRDANVVLLAGSVNISRSDYYTYPTVKIMYEASKASEVPEKTAEVMPKSIFEYYIYKLPYAVSLNAKERKYVSLFLGKKTDIRKKYVFEMDSYMYSKAAKNAKIILEIENKKEKGLGIPLVAGKVRVYKKDSNNTLVFLGESSIKNTAKDENASIYIGDAFDVIATMKKMDEIRISDKCKKLNYEVEIRNRKNEAVESIVKYNSYGNIQITNSTRNYVKKSAYTYEFYVPVEADGKALLQFEVVRCY